MSDWGNRVDDFKERWKTYAAPLLTMLHSLATSAKSICRL